MRTVNRRVWLWVLPVLLYAGPAAAQDERVQVSFGTATAAGSGNASLALTASAGYRFQERLLVEVDLTATESPMGRFLEPSFGPGGGMIRAIGGPATGMRRFGGPMAPDPARGPLFERAIGFAEAPRFRPDGDIFIATLGLRYELGLRGSRLQPYVGGGLGLARSDTEFTIARRLAFTARPGDADLMTESISRTGMAASAGIGTSFRVFRQLSLDVDTRYLVLDRGPNLTRFGGGVSYRF